MTIKKKKETLLEEAIRQFNTASTGLEKSESTGEGGWISSGADSLIGRTA